MYEYSIKLTINNYNLCKYKRIRMESKHCIDLYYVMMYDVIIVIGIVYFIRSFASIFRVIQEQDWRMMNYVNNISVYGLKMIDTYSCNGSVIIECIIWLIVCSIDAKQCHYLYLIQFTLRYQNKYVLMKALVFKYV